LPYFGNTSGKKKLMRSVALAIEKLRASGNNIKLLVLYTITNQQHIATGTRTFADSSFINGDIPSSYRYTTYLQVQNTIFKCAACHTVEFERGINVYFRCKFYYTFF